MSIQSGISYFSSVSNLVTGKSAQDSKSLPLFGKMRGPAAGPKPSKPKPAEIPTSNNTTTTDNSMVEEEEEDSEEEEKEKGMEEDQDVKEQQQKNIDVTEKRTESVHSQDTDSIVKKDTSTKVDTKVQISNDNEKSAPETDKDKIETKKDSSKASLIQARIQRLLGPGKPPQAQKTVDKDAEMKEEETESKNPREEEDMDQSAEGKIILRSLI